MIARLSRLLNSRSVVSGAALYVGMRWFDRLIGVISTIVLARLLTPDDFGIVALAILILGLATVMLDLGVNVAVVQRSELDREDLNTAWTIRLLQNGAVALALTALAAPLSRYYGDLRLEPVLWLLAFAYFLDGLTGMGPVIFQRRQQYAREVTFYAAKRLFGFVLTLALALWLRSFWALVYGTVLANGGAVVLSYVMHRQRHRLTLERWRQFLGASLWLALRTMAGYALQELDKFVVGRREGAAVLGSYSLASQIAAMPTTELLAPLSRALFPAFAALKDDETELRRLFLLALGVQCALALPAAVGLAMIAGNLVPVLLGEKWISAVPIMVALSIGSAAHAITQSCGYLLTALGEFRSQSLLQWFLVAVLATLIFGVFKESGADELAWARVIVGGVSIVAVVMMTLRTLDNTSLGDITDAVRRPTLATGVMAASVWAVGLTFPNFAVWAILVTKMAVGVVVYVSTVWLLWNLDGKPEGAEAWILARLPTRSTRSTQ